jgi:hypothetical protein
MKKGTNLFRPLFSPEDEFALVLYSPPVVLLLTLDFICFENR